LFFGIIDRNKEAESWLTTFYIGAELWRTLYKHGNRLSKGCLSPMGAKPTIYDDDYGDDRGVGTKTV